MSNFMFDANDRFGGFNEAATPADGCTQCNICLSVCPTFKQTQDVQQSPMGRIRIIRSLAEGPIDKDQSHSLDSCLACYACESVCPSKVNYRNMLDQALETLHQQQALPRISRWMLALSLKPALLRFLISLSAIAQALGIRQLLRGIQIFRLLGIGRAEKILGKVTIPKTTLKNRVQRPRYDQRVNLFTGCFTSVLEQEIQENAIELLNALGIEVVVPELQECCGALHRHNGDTQTALRLARHNRWLFQLYPAAATLFSSSGCGSALQDYGLWQEDEELALPHPVMDITHYIYKVLEARRVLFNRLPLKVALHTPCSLKQGEGQADAVSSLLQMIPQLEIHALSGVPACCGAGGTQMLSQANMADALRDQLIDEIEALKPDVLITSNLGCRLHLQAGLVERGLDVAIQHPIQLILQAVEVEFVSVARH